ncbi:hypothetical protein [Hyalangium rubrum]|uniref:Uncharacterized protein n=1 Tax=Hyalangium rubrum TaxID=3103134 RepID=A0ABU5HDN4_9BACT|nr:hypothetical protein [Hyalangium sp. s54d21]MDY7230215.1 hypothetical protein [Hyalangium sp. s54d21]
MPAALRLHLAWRLGLLLCLLSLSGVAAPPTTSLPARVVPGIMESTRAKVLAALARGDIVGAIAAYEAHVGRRAPEWLRALQTAYSTKNQDEVR